MNSLKKKSALTAIVAGAAFLTTAHAPAAHAQTTGVLPIRVKTGVLLPQGDARDFAGKTHFNAEAELLLPRIFPGSGITGVNIGYSQGSRAGRTLRMIPITIERLYGLPNPAARVTGNIYGGAGIGPYFLRTSGGGFSSSKTVVGGFGVVGYQFPSKLFVEAKYHVAGKIDGISPRGVALLVGTSF